MATDLERLCMEVIRVMKAAGEFIRAESKTFSAASIEHKGHNDLVSYVDKTAEKKLVEELSVLLPRSGFITEEKTSGIHGKVHNWIIDPLDGTTNFIHGVPCYCISVALTENDSLSIGVVYEINSGECFYAWKNGGAFLDGKKISVSDVGLLKDSLLATGFPYTNYTRMKEYMEVFHHLMHHSHGLRRLGSAAVDLAYVACGRFEGFYEYGLNAWDVAAGALLVKEAGGKVSDFTGGENFIFGRELIASNAATYNELLTLIKEKFNPI